MNVINRASTKGCISKTIIGFLRPILLIGGIACLLIVVSAQNMFAQEGPSAITPSPQTPLADPSCEKASQIPGVECKTDRFGTQSLPLRAIHRTPTPAFNPANNVGSLSWDELQNGLLPSQSGPSSLIPSGDDTTGSRGEGSDEPAPLEYVSPASFGQSFGDVALLPGQGWFFRNNSSPLGVSNWFQGNPAVFPAHAGDPAAYIAANFNNTAGTGTISNWMLTPVLTLTNGDTFSFWTRTASGSSWPDRLELRLSLAGGSTNVGNTAASIGDFSTLLLSVNPSLVQGGYPGSWARYSVTLAGMPGGVTGRFAFRYYVTDAGPSGANSNYIGIDTVEYTGSLAAFSCSNVTQIPQNECQALVSLYNSTGGSNWTDRAGWLVTNTPCNWYGVFCNGGYVEEIFLGNNQLVGTIPGQLGNLTNLKTLWLMQNQLVGDIPAELGSLVRLESLSLWANQLDGSIPSSLGGLASLVDLNLMSNELSGAIPPELGNLTNLQNLILADNQLSGGIPTQLTHLANLRYLWLWVNQLSGPIPSSLGNLANLQSLYLDHNQLSGNIPSSLGNLVNLQGLFLGSNQLSGAIPSSLGNLINLRGLSVWNNQLVGNIPSQLGSLANLEYLDLDDNQFTGAIPSELGNLINLQDLYLSGNQLSGNIPSSLGNLVNLLGLSLGSNQLSGAIPPSLGNLVNLHWLYLGNNQLSGAIPNQFCNLSSLVQGQVDLGFNKLSDGPTCVASVDPDWANTQTVPPGGLQAITQSASQVRLTWIPILYTGDGGFYEVSYAINAGGPFTVHGVTPDKNASSYLVTGLSPATTYYFRLRTHTPAHGWQQNDLWSDYSAIVWNTTSSGSRLLFVPLVVYTVPGPGAPVLYPITPPGANSSYNVTWSAAASATSYVLQRATSASFAGAVQVYAGGARSFTAPSQGIARYYYRVQARNQWGNSPWSNVQSVDVGWEQEPNDTSATANGPLVSGMNYYGFPNDASDYFFFQTSRRGQITIDLNNHTGQGVQLLLYHPVGNQVAVVGEPPYRLEYTGDAGTYYVRIYATGNFNSTTPYTLRAAFPVNSD